MFPNLFDDKPFRTKAKAATTFVFLIAANIAAWVWAWVAFADRPALMGTAFLAYMLGLRHAFDPDHIAAIDNVVRKLMQEGKAPYSVGFFFSLGHSTIVILASIVIAATAAAMQLNEIAEIGGVIGTTVSAVFLLIIGIANLLVLNGIWSAFKRARRGEKIVDEDLDALLAGRGLIARIFRPVFRVVSRSWHMYPIGFLFGLGFDTATEIGLLGISAMQAAQGMSFWAILVFPALFTAGMSLMDTADSVLMTGAYGWAFVNPVRKLWYNLTITAASVVVAVFIGGLMAAGLIVDKLGLNGHFWRLLGELNDNLSSVGYGVVGIFIVSWIISIIVYRRKGYDTLPAQ
ncbi:HoxN/HupN/NixA family nickel/cobalt transporter [Agrobacterium rhizogenes]|uniref:HoxN/HupN/NixA family nickel/cobalt transporter n=1 Tax=Rhizobium rhizogenes TaxID=359 RepID=UPI001572F5A1|nr:HoxN/HupN/NixA family nickel/cobalt transporter [Rhizobium rhizogenes]NTF52942.1 HoxN/HupN/NixA family nickel/cobalt transporter [Rhizobium rhizogenes]NTH10152.1 HoxN/HupN/NixA family nickel/cobalt transporter [Rhizobium rhizogenes]NTH42704.1 HoxN/HupN/NixA family nickel/cobalt transporter [Rhizobium rhizogenes]NTI06711.1 HoxN/HupN/NixA family nickel/cobalt transporter [Rhizobium rhizogenes]NTI13516.1 HoxN/HupN/NixA family nickel/cobalt transporter [Rhizobium rhizogenes]